MSDPAVIENEEDALEAKRLQEQCFLINSFEGFAESNMEKTYENFIPIQHDSPMEIVQKLLAIPDLMGLMSIKPYLLSALVPQIRLYKVHYESVSASGTPIEMPFEDFLSASMLENITASGSQRGMGVGLKSFEWELLGTNPAESDNNIKAKLKLHFNTLEDFVTPRGYHAGTETEVSYMNLIVPVKKFNLDTSDKCEDKQSEGQRSYNNKYFRLKVSVGYGTPAGSIWDAAAEGAALKGAIDNARQFFYLTLISHSLDFREDGSLDLEVEYVAAMEGALIHPKADVLLISDQAEAIMENIEERAAEEADQQEAVDAETEANCKNDEDDDDEAEELEEMQEDNAQDNADDKAILYKAILSALEDTGGIYSFSLDAEDVGELSGGQAANADDIERPTWSKADVIRETTNMDGTRGVSGSTAELGDAVDSAADDGGAEAAQASAAAEPDEQQIMYFHFGDLLDVALGVLYKNGHPNELSEIKCLTGPYVYFNPNSGKLSSQYNMCDIPIAMNLFSVWFMDNVVKPQRLKYPLKQFIKDAVTGLVGAAMKPQCFGSDYGAAPASLSMQLIEAPATNDGKCRVTNTDPDGAPIGGKRVAIDAIMPYPDAIDAETAKAYSYLFMYVSSAGANAFGPPQDGEGTREERDSKLGIYHMRIGSDSGLLKKVKFKKSDQPYAREARMEQAGELDGDSLREKYDADVELFGNAIFKPGTHCYIDPTTVGAGDPARIETLARRMGLGGYFMVTKVKSAIESGKFSTDLETIWVASGSGKAPTDACGESDEECSDGAPGTPVT